MSWQRTAVFLAALAIVPSQALAQQGPRDRAARSLISDAVEEYQNLEIDRSLERLQNAMRTCGNGGCSAAMTARVHMSIGIVQVGGQQNTNAGVESMVQALRLDPRAEPDAMLVTPEISAAFRQAQGQVANGGSRPVQTPVQTPPSNPNPRHPPSQSGGELLHTPAPEQLANTPLPVYVEPSGTFSVEHVYVYYKGNGMRSFERREMNHAANGYGAEIPCAAMIAPSMEYYVTAVDANTQVVATVGSETSPVQVAIVTRRSHPAPSLPGRAPPETCAADTEECPPGMTGPQCRSSHPVARGNRGLGDPCSSNEECGEGLHCDAGACGVGEASTPPGGETPEPTDPNAPATQRFSIDGGFGIGAAFLTGRPSYAEQRILVNSAGTVVGRNCGDVVCYQTIDPGFAPTYYFSLNARYNLTPRIGVGIQGRIQLDTAPWTIEAMGTASARSNPFANLLLTARLYYAFTPHGFAARGFTASAFAGGGVGQIEPKPTLPSSETRDGAHVLSGYGNAHAGVRVEYALASHFHVAGEVALQFMFPTFLFDIDTTFYVGAHF